MEERYDLTSVYGKTFTRIPSPTARNPDAVTKGFEEPFSDHLLREEISE